MKASETRLRVLLEGQKHYVIPLFQRPYTWEHDDWSTLWNDILEAYSDGSSSGHFLGSIVSKAQSGTPEGVSPFIVIDGQQRLTTLSIALAALRDRIGEKDPGAVERIDEFCLINKWAKGEYRYKIRPTQADRSAFFRVIDRVASVEEPEPSLIVQAYDFFFESLGKSSDEEQDEPLDLGRLERLLLDEVEVVSITLGDDDNEYRIFESLNWKGAPLSQADLLRNYFFMRIPAEQQQSLYDEVWLPLQLMLDSNALADFFRYQYMSSGEFVREKDIYLKWRGKLDRLNPDGLASMLRELARYARFYKRIIDPEAEPDAAIRERLTRLNRWGGQTTYPFLLWLYEGAGGREVSPSAIVTILEFVESYLVRRLFCGIPTAGSNRFFMELANQVPDGEIVGAVHQALSLPSARRRWPSDDDFREGLLTYRLYTGSRAEQRRLVIGTFERDHAHKEPPDLRGLTVEHVMPQGLTAEWRDALGPDADAIHSRFLHTLGNLTLTGYNPELSNSPFSEKRRRLAESNLALNREIADEAEWGPEQIVDRAERLAERALRIWQGPVEVAS
ncbi:MAG: DUF262 domain-containing protein [Chloroflexi bacterium]|nr:DUF262 domain-containing protein [Chloroflexota bacterium]